MLRTRLWMGAVLIALAAATLAFDEPFRPWYPFLLLLLVVLGLFACLELLDLLGKARPAGWLCVLGVAAVLLANWPAHLPSEAVGGGAAVPPGPWPLVLSAFAAFVLTAFLVEMAAYSEPGGSVVRVALAVWVVAYLGLLPSFLAQLRWLPDPEGHAGPPRGVGAVALAIFVPKFCDIGAYFTGRPLGRHRMAPRLSPGKTWEGLAGGLVVAALAAFAFNRWAGVLPGNFSALGFGLAVGLAGVFGDLAESLIKRDCARKDASQTVPGFGGVLDVVDSVLFAAPVAYWWLRPG
jgi:phosphatidate cytidylyltransferase